MFEDLKQKLGFAYKKVFETQKYFSTDEVFISIKESISGKDYFVIKGNDFIILDSECKIIEGSKEKFPEVFFTHYLLYKTYPFMTSIISSDSKWLSVWAATGKALPPVTMLHSRNYFGEIPCATKIPDISDTNNIYVKIGKSVLETLSTKFVYQCPAVFVRALGAIVWGLDENQTLSRLFCLEEIAERTYLAGIKMMERFSYLPYELSLKNYLSKKDSLPLEEQIKKNDFLEQWVKNCEELLK